MLSIQTKLHIFRQAKKNHILLVQPSSRNIKEYLSNVPVPPGTHILISALMGTKILNASVPILSRHTIIINAAWAAQIVLFPTSDTFNAFTATIGHELTHLEGNDIPTLKHILHARDHRFISWVNEVHADYGGTEKSLSLCRMKMLQAIDFKILHHPYQSDDTCSHPSWEKRREYISQFNFNNDLIHRIAADTKCTNKSLISDTCNHFADIILV